MDGNMALSTRSGQDERRTTQHGLEPTLRIVRIRRDAAQRRHRCAAWFVDPAGDFASFGAALSAAVGEWLGPRVTNLLS